VFWKKGKRIEELVLRHLRQVDTALGTFHEALLAYVIDRDIPRAKALALETHKAEGRADDIRREVERELLAGALLAPSRRDILEIIEQIDRLANSGETVLDTLLIERMEIPSEIVPYVEETAAATEKIVAEVNEAVRCLFHNVSEVVEHTRAIERLEGEIDRHVREAMRTVFKMEIDLARKLQLRNLLEQLEDLSDRAEDLSDRIDVMVAERRY